MKGPRPKRTILFMSITGEEVGGFDTSWYIRHPLSSYNLVTPYHSPKDEASIVNIEHMAQVISATTKAVRLLSDGPKPTWHPGGRPDAPAPRPPR